MIGERTAAVVQIQIARTETDGYQPIRRQKVRITSPNKSAQGKTSRKTFCFRLAISGHIQPYESGMHGMGNANQSRLKRIRRSQTISRQQVQQNVSIAADPA